MRYCPHCRSELQHTEIEGIGRLRCEAPGCDFVHWNNPVPVVAAVVEYRNHIVLARNAAWPSGLFGLITGFLERCETPEQGILREVEEELGLQGEIVRLIGNYAFERANQVILAYHVRAHGRLHLNHELAEVRHIPPNELRPWDFGTGLAVRDWLAQPRSSD